MPLYEREELEMLELLEKATAAGDERAELVALEALEKIENVRGMAPETPGAGELAMSASVAVPEAMLQMGSAAAAEPLAGLAGIATGIGNAVGITDTAPADAVRATQDALTYQPRGASGQMISQGLGTVMAPVGEALETSRDAIGSTAVKAGELVGVDPQSETAAALYAGGSAVPDAALSVLGLKGGKGAIRPKKGRPAAVLDDVADDAVTPAAALDDTAQRLQPAPVAADDAVSPAIPQTPPPVGTGKAADLRRAIQNGEKAGAAHMIDNAGRVVADKQAKKVIQQGFSDRAVATIKGASRSDRLEMNKMLTMAERGLKDAKFRARYRPSDVIGENVMKRWEVIDQANRKARVDINRAAMTDLRGKQVNIADAVDGFIDDLDDLGVTVGDDLAFKGSQLEGNAATAAMRRVYKRLSSEADGLSLHKLKQYIDSQIDWNKSPDRPLDTKAVASLKRLRGRINEELAKVSPDYADANARAAKTFGVLDDLNDVLGRRFDPTDMASAKSYAGQEMRKVLSNYQKRTDLLGAIDNLDDVAREFGGQFADDPVTQSVFLSDMERVFGSFADNSFQGGIEKGVGRAAQYAEAGAVGKGVMAIQDGAAKLRGIGEEGAIREMRKLLNR